jgi:putative SOS response-associated peptidase YedK
VCNLYSITTNQAAIIALFRVMNRHVGNLPRMPGLFPDYPAPVVRNAGDERELTMMGWGMPPPLRMGGPPVTNILDTSSPHWRGWQKPENPGCGARYSIRPRRAERNRIHNRCGSRIRLRGRLDSICPI